MIREIRLKNEGCLKCFLFVAFSSPFYNGYILYIYEIEKKMNTSCKEKWMIRMSIFCFAKNIIVIEVYSSVKEDFRNKFFSFVTKKQYLVTKVFKNRFKHHIIVMDVSIHFCTMVFHLKSVGEQSLHFSFWGNKKNICKLLQVNLYTV